ncbi:MAG: YaeQ family protein, partial [Nitrospira sp.]|nr:YaeQ family protein [Nitrospira sp.]
DGTSAGLRAQCGRGLVIRRGVGTEDEPALWQRDLTGAIDCWIEIGQPDDKLLRQACGRSKQVIVYTYGARSAEGWWANQKQSLDRLKNLAVTLLPMESVRAWLRWHDRPCSYNGRFKTGMPGLPTVRRLFTWSFSD